MTKTFESPIQIDEMKDSDLSEVGELAGQLGYPSSHEDLVRRYHVLRTTPAHQLFVARYNSKVVGWVHVGQEMSSLLTDERADIGALVVDSKFRSLGIGSLLMKAAEFWAENRKLKRMRVRSNTKRENAHHFYQRQGYEKIKSWHLFTKNLEDSR
ncbi:MAG: GNAT family N-acetyltransferase [Bdellovibrionales bacterium]|nr:GNAT family N-acetyltransferase [Bdellovibrionales bacterium]